MRYINLTPHSISVYDVSQFVNLTQTAPTTWVADDTIGVPVLFLSSVGNARIAVSSKILRTIDGVDFHQTTYADILGLPDDGYYPDDILVVSLPTASNAKASNHPLSEEWV